MTRDDEPVFIDTNVLVYAAVENAPLHDCATVALKKYQDAGVPCWVNRQVLREFMCIMTRPQTFMPVPAIATVIQQVHFLEHHFQVAEDNKQITSTLLVLLEKHGIGGKRVHDANIAATMIVHRIPRILSHNVRDFEAFSDVISVLPLDT